MSVERTQRVVDTALPQVYAVARAAAASERIAERTTERVVTAAALAGEEDVRVLAARVSLAAAREQPAPAFAALPADARDAVVLARLCRMRTPEIAATLDVSEAEVRRRLTAALRTLAAEVAVEPIAA